LFPDGNIFKMLDCQRIINADWPRFTQGIINTNIGVGFSSVFAPNPLYSSTYTVRVRVRVTPTKLSGYPSKINRGCSTIIYIH